MNEIRIWIFFADLKETVISEYPKFQPQDLVGNLGGQIGLFLGASFLTLTEFLELLVRVLFICFNRSKTEKKSDSKPDSSSQIYSLDSSQFTIDLIPDPEEQEELYIYRFY